MAPGGDGALSRPVYDVPHAVRPWGWRVSAYLWTKSIAAGALLVAALAGLRRRGGSLHATVAPAISLAFLLLTLVLLVVDLKRPDRFAYILLKPNWRSWLVWGAWILMAFGGAGGVVAARRAARRLAGVRPDRAGRAAGAGGGRLQRVPVRPGGGARLLAEPDRAAAPARRGAGRRRRDPAAGVDRRARCAARGLRGSTGGRPSGWCRSGWRGASGSRCSCTARCCSSSSRAAIPSRTSRSPRAC